MMILAVPYKYEGLAFDHCAEIPLKFSLSLNILIERDAALDFMNNSTKLSSMTFPFSQLAFPLSGLLVREREKARERKWILKRVP